MPEENTTTAETTPGLPFEELKFNLKIDAQNSHALVLSVTAKIGGSDFDSTIVFDEWNKQFIREAFSEGSEVFAICLSDMWRAIDHQKTTQNEEVAA